MKDVSIITDPTVNVHIVRIDGKQMTLAFFRQIQRRDIFDEECKLLARPLGWVNYETTSNITPYLFMYDGALYRYDLDLRVIREWGPDCKDGLKQLEDAPQLFIAI